MKKQDSTNTSQAMWIAIGSLCSFLFAIVSSAILSRYLAKDAYGTYKQVMYVYTTLLSVFTLGLPLAYSYFLPRVSIAEGKSLVDKINAVFFVLGVVFAIVLYFGADIVANILNNPELGPNLRIFSPAPVFLLPTMGLQGILATYKRTMLNALYVLITRVFMLICVALPVAFYKSSVEVAIWGFLVSSFISMVVALIIKNVPFHNVVKERTNVSYKQIFNYSIPLMAAGLLGVAIHAADQFYVSRFFGQEVFADFANGSLELPFVSMVLSASGTVLLPVFSRMLEDKTPISTILDLWKRSAVKATYILYPLVTFSIFFATEIMTFIYGSRYEMSGVYFRIQLIVNFFTVIQYYPIILALGKTKEYAWVHFVNFVIVWATEYLAILVFDSAVAVTVVSVVCKVLKILLVINVVASAIDVKIWSLFPLRELLTTFICCFVAGIGSYYFVSLLPIAELKLLVLVVGLILFVGLVLLLGRLMKIDFFSVIRPITNKLLHR